ncbi:mitochondrial import inner membrane translocase subunit Tim10 B-like isoform X2 [Cimex lectularius]|uniref:Mitochondrial import inner membrane translocase subunit n=1 Tax=Cimex lectularius TaxID=79782 RepID=A0A8I6S2F3_CIMLE|nr:mitochondrial import inner membrane translocase subunit Tim10 B-like isoform X2 [Cimex lectularius]XP_024086249.1 mitochondrial import inner membrane translocase subunit Tim10 B-like isoform X2 [Cimex lectularius]XP_024086250.1 mitochondrial import inner membrane translocase subunit Tim10 B-like isoform X2 [Cimex lectularius]
MSDVQIRQMRDFLDIYNKISEKCFNHCVYTMGYRELTEKESRCVDLCATKFLYGGQSIMKTYVEIQPQITERRIQEMNKMMEDAAMKS